MTPRPRHGPAGLLVALFVVAGLVFSYGLGHPPPPQVCTAHALHAPADVPAFAAPSGGGTVLAVAAPGDAPVDPATACLGLAVLLGLMVLALALPRVRPLPPGPGRPRRAARAPTARAPGPPSLAALQVLRV
ncbi:hypothetical protein [Actinomadura flavalba]|uniref:hypothetical protein n=1 Tax=Actinomadura flavalba TaxID=1120938 RepID=UPI0012DD768F|nr:hypothetical protein [Actinomadura flavalba]